VTAPALLTDDQRLALGRDDRLALYRARKATPEAHPRVTHLWKTCIDCGRTEVAGWFCTYCFLPMYEGDFYAGAFGASEPVDRERRALAVARHGHLSERLCIELRPAGAGGNRIRGTDPEARQADIERRRAARAAGKP
jgi:hypothetical protein